MSVKNRLIVFEEKLRLNSLKYLKILNNQVCYSCNMQQTGTKWADRHYQIAEESDKKFKTHTKDQEIDI